MMSLSTDGLLVRIGLGCLGIVVAGCLFAVYAGARFFYEIEKWEDGE